jgi:hypothetical protein
MSDNKEQEGCCDSSANNNETQLPSGAPAGMAATEGDSRQEQNWRLMTVLQIPWHHANSIEDESDRKFLLNKATEVEGFLQMQQQQMQQQQQAGQGGTPNANMERSAPSPIISPH